MGLWTLSHTARCSTAASRASPLRRARSAVSVPRAGRLAKRSATVVCATRTSPSAGRTAPIWSRNARLGPITKTPCRARRSRWASEPRGAVEPDSGLAGARCPLHADRRLGVGADDRVLLRLDGRDDVSHRADPGPLRLGCQDRTRALVLLRIEQMLVFVCRQLAPADSKPTTHDDTHRIGPAGSVERGGHRSPPVDHQGIAGFVANMPATDMPAFHRSGRAGQKTTYFPGRCAATGAVVDSPGRDRRRRSGRQRSHPGPRCAGVSGRARPGLDQDEPVHGRVRSRASGYSAIPGTWRWCPRLYPASARCPGRRSHVGSLRGSGTRVCSARSTMGGKA